MISILFLCIFSSFNYSFCFENFKKTSFDQRLLKPFFPITDAYKRIVPVFSYTKNNIYTPLHDEQTQTLEDQKETEFLAGCLLHKNTVQLLTDCQNMTYGFCYGGMLKNGHNPKLTLVNHQHPYYLNLELYYFKSNTIKDVNISVRSKNMDSTFYPGLTKKQKNPNNAISFWQTSCYHTQKNRGFCESYSSFWGPFFDKHHGAGCFFYTDIESKWNTGNTCSGNSTTTYPAYALFYHFIHKEGLTYYQSCYISHKPSNFTPLYAYEDQYFLLVLATFFPCKEINGKKIFYTYTYNVTKLNSLQVYLNRVRYNPILVPRKLEKNVQNSALHILLLHFLNQTKGSAENQEFYTEINSKINALKQKRTANHTQNYSINKKRPLHDQ